MSLVDVDPAKGTITIGYSANDDRLSGAVGVDLLNGRLFAVRRKPLGSQPTDGLYDSPDRRFRMWWSEDKSEQVSVTDRKGRKLGRISPVIDAQWSPDSRYIACIMSGGRKPKDMPGYMQSRVGRIHVYTPQKVTRVLSVAKLGYQVEFSPDGRRIAFIEIIKDEYGDHDLYALKVADIASRRVTLITTNRREPKFVWAGRGALAVSTYDKYAVPSVSLVDVATRKWIRLATDRRFAGFEPLASMPSKRLVAYKASWDVTGEQPEELWAARPGSAPVKLFPRAGGLPHAKR